MNRRKLVIVFLMLIMDISFIGYSIHLSYNHLTINEFDYHTSKVSESIKAVVLSDLHNHEFEEQNEELISKVASLNPDVIFLVGDMLNNDSENSDIVCHLISKLGSICPVYFTQGNHEQEYIENGHAELCIELEAAGAVVLNESYVDVELKGNKVRIGSTYEYTFELLKENLSEEQQVVRDYLLEFVDTDSLKIMLAHRPDSFVFADSSEIWDIDLVISGHNHGGQVVLPFVGGVFGGDQGYFPEYVHGLYKKDKIHLFITSGLGSNPKLLPRFNNYPEIAVLEMKSM